MKVIWLSLWNPLWAGGNGRFLTSGKKTQEFSSTMFDDRKVFLELLRVDIILVFLILYSTFSQTHKVGNNDINAN